MPRTKIVLFTLLVAFAFACSPNDGIDGIDGLDGAKGEQGIQGEQGTDGNDGVDGEKGEQGEQGAGGIDGIDGNANVKKYTITIAAADWKNAVHGGNGNIFNYYNIPSSLTGDIYISNTKYLVLAYGKPSGFSYNQTKLLPYTFGMETDYGIKFELDVARNQVTMSKTTNGWNNTGLDLADRPTSFALDIFMIEVKAAMSAKTVIDLNNYSEVVEYFKLD